MSILDVLTYPNPILKQQSTEVTAFDKSLKNLIKDMFATMDAHQGVGLAAPQIGILDRILVFGYKGKRRALINPVITQEDGETVDDEGCLSIPDFTIKLRRADKISVEAKDGEGRDIALKESGYVARIIQHEIDHLNGILIIDKKAVV